MAGEIDATQNERILTLEIQAKAETKSCAEDRLRLHEKIDTIFNAIHGDGLTDKNCMQALLSSIANDQKLIVKEQCLIKEKLKDYPWIQKIVYGLAGSGLLFSVALGLKNLLK